MRKFIFIAACVLAVVSCKKNAVEPYEDLMAITLDAIDVTPYSATLVAAYRGGSPLIKSISPYMLCSTNPTPDGANSLTMNYYSSMPNDEYHFFFENLEPGTTYYYMSSAKFEMTYHDGIVYGEIKSFTTPSVETVVTTEQPIPTSRSALMRGHFSTNLTEWGYDVSVQAWFYEGKEGAVYEELKRLASVYSDGTFEAMSGNGSQETPYCYQACVSVNGVEYRGDIVEFLTVDFAPSEGEAIDMGYGLKWASCNVGASKPEETGDYFAWGETATKTSFTQGNYLFPYSPDYLSLDNDAAHAIMGGAWRMPTINECEMLTDHNRIIEEYGTYNGVFGHLLISKKTGERLFFPAAGYKEEEGINSLGECAYYWTSTCSIPDCAYNMRFDGDSNMHTENSYRNYAGYTVRGVCE